MLGRGLDRLFLRFRERQDGAALAAVFDATSRELLKLACHLVRDSSEAEDLVQATFLTAIVKAGSYDGSTSVQGWLYGILWREAAKSRRTASRRLDPHRLDPRPEADALAVLSGKEVQNTVARALESLPRHYREVLEPVIREDERPEEIAQRLGRSPGTVRSQIHRGFERLRRALPDGVASFPALGPALGLGIRGLPEIRAAVLRSAGFPASTAAAVSPLALKLTLGGALLSKTTLVFSGAALAVLAGVWIAADEHSPGAGSRETALASEGSDPDPRARYDRGKEASANAAEGTRQETLREMGAGSASAPAPAQPLSYWRARFAEAPEDWRHGWAVAAEIAKLAPDEGLVIMTALWPELSVPVKEQVLKPFVFDGGHPSALGILDLAATDGSLSVQGRAFAYLKDYAFEDFAIDYEAYLRWAAAYRDRPLDEVLSANARRFVASLAALPPEELGKRMVAFDRLDLSAGGKAGVDLAAILRENGGLAVLETALAAGDPEVQKRALDWSRSMGADETWLRTFVLPAIDRPGAAAPDVISSSLQALGRPDCGWAREPILAYLSQSARAASEAEVFSAARALAEIGDPAAIPGMIEVLLHDKTGKMEYGVGYYGLAKLTGVRWQKGYDGAWWLEWWEKNRMRFPPGLRDTAIRR